MIISLDVGTSVTKAARVSRDGRITATASRRSRLRHGDGGRVEQDLEEVVESAVAVVREVAAGGGPVDALAMTGQGDGLWLRDRHGAAVRPPISWLDARASGVLDEWQRNGVCREVHRATGQAMFPGSHGPLLAHLAAHEPEHLAAAAVAGYCVDSLVHRFTGEITVDASDASMPFLDPRTRRYRAEALAATGLSDHRRLLPDPAAPGAVFPLTRQAGDLLGLPAGLPVTGGPFDLVAAAFGTGATRPGDGTVVIGTTLGCEVLHDRVPDSHDGPAAGMWLCTPEPDRYLRVMPAMVGTASLDWLLGLLNQPVSALESLLATTDGRAGEVTALPFLSPSGERAPFLAPRARGQFTGLSLATTPADLVRALCESIAFAGRHCLDAASLAGELWACGGGSRSARWLQIFADVLGQPLRVPAEDNVGLRGAALFAWRALGDPVDAAAWRAADRVVEPDTARHRAYEPRYAAYLAEVADARSRWDSPAAPH